jgi:lipid-A-disaccharide synthase
MPRPADRHGDAEGTEAPLIYLVAGEPSGDLLGAHLMRALRLETGHQVRFAGVGGEQMAEEGLGSLFPLADIAVIGLIEVLPKARTALRRVCETVDDIQRVRPAALVTIDSWGFAGRVAKRLKAAGSPTPRIHYVAPMVWAWRPGRARVLARLLDHLLCLLPNEPAYFEARGLGATHVGHAVIESGAERGDGPGFRRRHGIAPTASLLCLLPGSRPGEASRLLPVFEATVRRLEARHRGLRVVVPTVDTVAEQVGRAAAALGGIVVRGQRDKYDAFAAADVALAASGTVALELALAGVPTVISYRLSPLTAAIARRLLRIRYVSLVNLVLDRPVAPEFLQERCRPDLLEEAVSALLLDPAAREAQRAAGREALRILGYGGPPPSARAARIVLDLIARRRDRE